MSPIVFQDTFFLASTVSAVIALVVAIVNVKKHSNLNWILILLIVSVSASFVNVFIIAISDNTNLSVGVVYRYAEFFVLFNFYWSRLKIKLKPIRSLYIRIVLGLSVTIIVIAIAELSILSIRSINSVTFIIFAVVLFWHMIKSLRTERIEQDPIFWLNSAIFIHFSGSFFLFLLRDYLIEHYRGQYAYIWSLHNMLSIVKNFLIGYAFTLNPSKEIASTSELNDQKSE